MPILRLSDEILIARPDTISSRLELREICIQKATTMSNVEFAVNGRFLTQATTGVQRYARNVVLHLDQVLKARSASATIFAPQTALDPELERMPLVKIGRVAGHAWEQFVLPMRWDGHLLNLCNTAPALKTKQVVCIHDANVYIKPESYSFSFKTYYRILQSLIVRGSANITTVSSNSAAQIAKHLSLDYSRINVLPNGHEHALEWKPELAQVAPSIIAGRGGEAGRPFVLAIGSQAEHKNMKLVTDIAPKLYELGIDTIIAGGSASIFSNHIPTNTKSVSFIGRIDDNDLAFLMDRALCLLFPSWTEGFGLPIVEAMARNCPVVSSDRASMPEICGQAALMAAPDDPRKWVEHVTMLSEYPDQRNELIISGQERVKKFSWRRTADAYADLMQN